MNRRESTADSPSSPGHAGGRPDGTWPWHCLGCGTTVFDDTEYCRACESSPPGGSKPSYRRTWREFVAWMRREPYSAFVLKVSVISGAEVALTALWLQLVLIGPTELLPGVLGLG